MSDSVKVYAMTNNDDSELNILNAIVEAAGALYVDVPGLGLVEITTHAALAAVKKMVVIGLRFASQAEGMGFVVMLAF